MKKVHFKSIFSQDSNRTIFNSINSSHHLCGIFFFDKPILHAKRGLNRVLLQLYVLATNELDRR